MRACPQPDSIVKVQNAIPASFTANPPTLTDESCSVTSTTTIISPSGTPISTDTVTYISGPPGPPGPPGEAACYLGLKWEGEWAEGREYKKANCPTNANASVVSRGGALWVCLDDHTSTIDDAPQSGSGGAGGGFYWDLMVDASDGGGLNEEDQSFFDVLKDGVFDFIENATVGDWIAAALVGAGLVYAGTQVVDALTDDGTNVGGAGSADRRYTGSHSYVPSGSNAITLPQLITKLCSYVGMTNIDVSQLPTHEVSVLLFPFIDVARVIDELSRVYQFDRVDSNGVLKFVPRFTNAVATLTLDDMGFGTEAGQAPFSARRLQGTELPRVVTVNYISASNDFKKFNQQAQLFTYTSGRDFVIDTPFVLPDEYARDLSEILLANAHLERMSYSFTVTYKWIALEPGDIINTPMGVLRIDRIEEKDEGLLDVIAFDAGDIDAITTPSDAYVQYPATSKNIAPVIGWSGAWFLDLPPLNSNDRLLRLYVAAHGYDAAGWPGCAVYKSDDNGLTYKEVASVNSEATWGMVSTALVNSNNHLTWDDSTTFTVTLKTNSLTSATDEQVFGGANRAMVGNEMIAFGTATLISPKTYQISHILRGRQGTEWAMSSHTSNELFVLLDNSIVEIPLAGNDRNIPKKYKVVTFGSDLSIADPQTIQVLGQNQLPWRVAQPKITKVGADFNITWVERNKWNNELQDYVELSHDEDWAGWTVLILNNSDVVVASYITQINSFTYTSAQQTTDFGAPQSTVKVRIHQLSKTLGGGHGVTVTG